jgi:hypothetical protein
MKPESITWNLREVADAIQEKTEFAIDWETGETDEEELSSVFLLEVELEKFVGAAGSAYRQLLAKADAYKSEARHYRDKALTIEGAANKLKQAVKDELEKLDLTKVEGPWGSANIQNSAPKVVFNDDAEVPVDFMVFPDPVPDKKRIAEYLKENGHVAEWAELTQDTHIRFR